MQHNSNKNLGQEMHDLVKELFPIHRSLTGAGVRKSLQILKEHLPDLEIHEVPTGTQCFDWTIPREWRISAAYIIDPDGNRICDIGNNNLHLVSYSIPVHQTMTLEELDTHLHSLPEQPDAIPYVTSYYKDYWGFCLPDSQRQQLQPGQYQVVIDSELFEGSLTYGELKIPGETDEEVLISTYICHPSMANDQLSGPVVSTFIANWIASADRRLSYRFVFTPETVGAIAFLSRNLEALQNNVIAGFNLSCVGDDGGYAFVESRKGNTLTDAVLNHVLKHRHSNHQRFSYLNRGSDERQYCSQGVNLPLCTVSRSKFGEFPEYHTSLDDLNLVTPAGLLGSFELLKDCFECLEANLKYRCVVPCEPQLGKRGLYPSLSVRGNGETVRDLTNFITYCDGEETLLEIANRLDRPVWSFYESVEKLRSHELIEVFDS